MAKDQGEDSKSSWQQGHKGALCRTQNMQIRPVIAHQRPQSITEFSYQEAALEGRRIYRKLRVFSSERKTLLRCTLNLRNRVVCFTVNRGRD